MKEKLVPLSGSQKKPLDEAKLVGDVDPNQKFEVTVILKKLSPTGEISKRPTKQSARVNSEGFSLYAASKKDLENVEEFAKESGLFVVEESAEKRSVVLSGTARDYAEAFGVELKLYEHPKIKGKVFRGRTGLIYIPERIAPIVLAVLGLDDRPQAIPHFRPLLPGQKSVSTHTPPEVAEIYDYPANLDGSGECIGLIELGGGFQTTDLEAYFESLGIPAPSVIPVPVDGAANSPSGDPSGPDGEVMLDIEIAGSIAPKSKIAVYFAPNTDRGFVDAIATAVNDTKNKPSVLSISWGGAEDTWTSQAIQSLNQTLEDAANLGITVFCASGDSGSSDGQSDGLAHVDFPSSSPYAFGCGGTRIVSIKSNGSPSEVVWNDGKLGGATGGGVSDVFPLPSWQSSAKVPPSVNPGGHIGRGVPDASGDADPSTGYSIRVDDQMLILGGTSAVAPLWAALVALINQKLGRSIGYFNPRMYENLSSQASGDFNDVTSGNNGFYSAGPGWDPCTGLGTPNGSKLLLTILGN